MLRRGYKSPMKEFKEDFFGQLLKTQYYQETHLESMRQQLMINCADLNALQVYRLFRPPADRLSGIGVNNVQHGFEALGIPLDSENARIVIKRFDSNRDGLLTYNEVCDIFKPKDVALGKQFLTRAKSGVAKPIPASTLQQLNTLFMQTLSVELENEQTKETLHADPNFKLTTAFELMNRVNQARNDKLSVTQLKNIL